MIPLHKNEQQVSRLMGITQIPGGPHLEKLANTEGANDKFYNLPVPMANSKDKIRKEGCDFSYSGLKTAIRTLVEKEFSADDDNTADEKAQQAQQLKRAHLAASFQRVAVDHLVNRTRRAVVRARQLCGEWKCLKGKPLSTLVVAGGVAANGRVRSSLFKLAEECQLRLLLPPPKYCVDNGVMVAWTGVERLLKGLYDEPPTKLEKAEYYAEVRPKWPIGLRDHMSCNYKEQISQKMRGQAHLKNKQPGVVNEKSEIAEKAAVTLLDAKEDEEPAAKKQKV